jgi:hypothetical protein
MGKDTLTNIITRRTNADMKRKGNKPLTNLNFCYYSHLIFGQLLKIFSIKRENSFDKHESLLLINFNYFEKLEN